MGGFAMRVRDYDRLFELQTNRRDVLKGAAAVAALSTADAFGLSAPAMAAAAITPAEMELRKQIMQIPGAGKGSPTDADWQKVGELCLGGTKASVKPGEFKGVELSFMGLNNQNLHNFL